MIIIARPVITYDGGLLAEILVGRNATRWMPL